MTKPIGSSSVLRSITAAFLAGLMVLSALHAAAPHHRSSGPCVACQSLSAPALVPSPDVPGHPPAPRRLDVASRRDVPFDSSAPRLRPLRAPPRMTLA